MCFTVYKLSDGSIREKPDNRRERPQLASKFNLASEFCCDKSKKERCSRNQEENVKRQQKRNPSVWAASTKQEIAQNNKTW